MDGNTWWQFGLSLLHRGTDMEYTLIIAGFFFLAADSLIAFKANLVYCVGLFMITCLRLTYQSPRPFWADGEIKVF